MFEASEVKTFMGGQFSLKGIDSNCKAKTLADEFQKWADEVRSWDNADHDIMIREVAIVKDKIYVTLENGIVQ